MGYDQVVGSSHYQLKKLWGGWFPNKPHNDIPGKLDDSEPVGAQDSCNIVWQQGRLRTMFGYSAITSPALNGGASINSLFYSPVFNDVFGNAGNKVYKGMDDAIPTDITGAVTISSTVLLSWTEWDWGTDNLVIACDGVNPPIKYNGVGNCAVLGGGPPVGRYVTTFQGSVWMVVGDEIYFSALGDPESWDTNATTGDIYRFDAPITGIGKLNDKLVVFMEDHIGILSGSEGDGNRLLVKDNRFINGIGCSGHFTIKNARINNVDCLVFHAHDGIYAFDGSQQVVKIGAPIEDKYISSESNNKFNATRSDKAVSTVDPRYNWYMTALSDGAQTENSFMLIQDTFRVFEYHDSIVTPCWPQTLAHPHTCIEFTRTLSKHGDVIFGTDDGIVYKYNPAIYNQAGTGYKGYFKTKIFDNITTVIVQEINVLGEEQGTMGIDMYLNNSLQEGNGDLGQADMSANNDFLDIDFIIGVSQLGGYDWVFRNLPVMNWGRFLQFRIGNTNTNEALSISAIDLIFQDIGVEPNVGL